MASAEQSGRAALVLDTSAPLTAPSELLDDGRASALLAEAAPPEGVIMVKCLDTGRLVPLGEVESEGHRAAPAAAVARRPAAAVTPSSRARTR